MKKVKSYSILFFSFMFSLFVYTKEEVIIQELYKDKSGFSINNDETQLIENSGGNATYGEITDKGVRDFIDYVKPTSNDVFYDLGSGIGRMATTIHLKTPVAKSVGVELSPTRHKQALQAKKELEQKGKLDKKRTLEFKNDDILKANIDDATMVYIASTCFSDDFMKKLTDKLAGLKKGLQVFTLRQLAKNDAFTLIKELSLPMTWSSNVTVYWYKLQ